MTRTLSSFILYMQKKTYSHIVIYRLLYEFTITKQDGTKLIFGGDNDCIEFATEKRIQIYVFLADNPILFFKTLPTSWMLREVISPKRQ